MKPKNVYLVLCAAGIVIPYTQLVPWLFEHGLNMRLLIEQLFSNRIGAFFGLDVLVSAVVVFAFAGFERGRLGSRWWLPVAAAVLFGVSAGLPLLLYLRETAKSASRAAA
jgi:hypothetical protein